MVFCQDLCFGTGLAGKSYAVVASSFPVQAAKKCVILMDFFGNVKSIHLLIEETDTLPLITDDFLLPCLSYPIFVPFCKGELPKVIQVLSMRNTGLMLKRRHPLLPPSEDQGVKQLSALLGQDSLSPVELETLTDAATSKEGSDHHVSMQLHTFRVCLNHVGACQCQSLASVVVIERPASNALRPCADAR